MIKDRFLKYRFLKWLKPEGVEYLKGIIKEHGHILAVWNKNGIPHAVHFNEGMQIRNWMREQPEFVDKLDSHWLDNNWAEFTEGALEKDCCGGFKHCQDKSYNHHDPDCKECIQDYERVKKELNEMKIKIHYWYSDLSELTGIEHKAEFNYSKEKRNELIDHFLDCSCEIMIRKFDYSLIIFIDNAGGSFRQR